jgi:hypothetical protein
MPQVHSRCGHQLGVLTLALGLATAGAPEGLAQGAPRPLLPQTAPAGGLGAPEGEGAPPSPVEPAIRAAPVEAPTVGQAGVLGAVPGIDESAWRASDPELAAVLLARLGPPGPYPTFRRLTRALLLAPGPPGPAGDALFRVRVERLLALGEPAAALQLLTQAPGGVDGALTTLRLRAALAADDDDATCRMEAEPTLAADLLAETRVFCRLVGGDAAAAALMLDALGESDTAVDPAFRELAWALASGGAAELEALPKTADPLALALLTRAPIKAADTWLGEATPPVLAALARNPTLPPGQRLRAAEAAAEAGLVTAEQVRSVALTLPPREGDVLAAIERGLDASVRGRVVQALENEALPLPRAALLHAAFRAAGPGPSRVVWAGVLAPYAEALAPERTLAWAADALVPILLAEGETARAREWLALLTATTRPSPAEQAALAALLPYRGLLGTAGEFEALEDRDDLLALIDGVGGDLPPAVWRRALGREREGAPTPLPALAVWRGLDAAVAAGRRAEALGYLLLLLDGTPEAAAPPALRAALRALGQLGFEDEALALAAATAVGLGL